MNDWMNSPDVRARIALLPAGESGRRGALRGNYFACPLDFEGVKHDCRIILGGSVAELGSTFEANIKFLNRYLALEKATVGTKFTIWEGGAIGFGEVIEVFEPK